VAHRITLLPKQATWHTYIHTHILIYTYIHIYMWRVDVEGRGADPRTSLEDTRTASGADVDENVEVAQAEVIWEGCCSNASETALGSSCSAWASKVVPGTARGAKLPNRWERLDGNSGRRVCKSPRRVCKSPRRRIVCTRAYFRQARKTAKLGGKR
jgi:hypothetical protein